MKRKTNEQFLKEVYELVGDEYIVLSKYQGSKTKVKFHHNVCNKEYEVTPNKFLIGRRCPYCNGTFKKTTQQFKEEVYNLVGNEYTVLGKYKNNHTRIKIKHNVCNKEYEVAPWNFLSGNRCPNCSGKLKKTTKQFKEEVYNLVQDEYSVLGEYKSAHTKIKVKHNKCGNTYYVEPSAFLNGTRCPTCFQKGTSHGNENIAKYLDNHSISYEREYKFKDCIYKKPLPFDFYLEEYNTCIEFDGEQHYSPNEFFEEHDPFKERKIKDNIKSKYCYDNDIKLIRIPYTKINEIDKILDNYFKTK